METPVAIPFTIPELLPTVASVELLLLHVPPAALSEKVTLLPVHTLSGPFIALGAVFTVTVVVMVQPVEVMYSIVEVPGTIPVTTPVDEPIVAVEMLLLVQVPPAVESVTVVVPPGQTILDPSIAGAAHPIGICPISLPLIATAPFMVSALPLRESPVFVVIAPAETIVPLKTELSNICTAPLISQYTFFACAPFSSFTYDDVVVVKAPLMRITNTALSSPSAFRNTVSFKNVAGTIR